VIIIRSISFLDIISLKISPDDFGCGSIALSHARVQNNRDISGIHQKKIPNITGNIIQNRKYLNVVWAQKFTLKTPTQ
jgi:hypothetical protein